MKPLKMVLVAIAAFVAVSVYAQNYMDLLAFFEGEHHTSGYGTSLATVDFNQDGYDDLVVCAHAYGYVHYNIPPRGKIYIYYGGPGFNSNTQPAITKEGTYLGPEGGGIRILRVYTIGDMNGDGFADLAVLEEEPTNNSMQRLKIFFGGTPDLDGEPDYVMNLTYSFHLLRIFPLGDLNGDGYDEIGITTYANGHGRTRYLILWGGSMVTQVLSDDENYYTYPGMLAGVGDINGDGYDDLLMLYAELMLDGDVSVFLYNVRIHYGSSQGLSDDTLLLYQTFRRPWTPPLAIGDVNGDGISDFIGFGGSQGMYAWFGAPEIDPATPNLFYNPFWTGRWDAFGKGDFNGDGYSDLVGTYHLADAFTVWLGNSNPNGTRDFTQYVYGHDNFGFRLTIGDFNADGLDDIATSAPIEHSSFPNGDYRGYVYVFAGNADLVGIDENLDPVQPNRMKVTINPNPCHATHGTINVKIEAEQKNLSNDYSIGIYNIKGQKVYEARDIRLTNGVAQLTLPVSHLASGVYLCRVTSGKDEAIIKYTIIK